MSPVYKIQIISILLFTLTDVALFGQDFPKLKELSEKESASRLHPSEKKGEWGYVDDDGRFKIKPVFDSAQEFRPTVFEGDTVISAKVSCNGKWGFLSDRGVFRILPEYDSLSDFDCGVSIFSRNGEFGMLDVNAQVLISGFDAVIPFDRNGIAWMSRDGLWGAYDLDGQKVFDLIYDSSPINRYGDLLVLERSGKTGLLDAKGRRVLVDCVADDIYPDQADRELIIVRSGEKYGCVVMDGTIVLPIECEMIAGGCKDETISFRQQGKYGLCDKSGKILIPPLMNTDQVSAGADHYQYFDPGSGFKVPMAYYQGEAVPMETFDAAVLNVSGSEADWRTDHPYVFTAPADDFVHDSSGIPAVSGIYVSFGRDRKIVDSEGLGLEPGMNVNKAFMRIDTLDVPCGSWLAPLLKFSSDKVASYDRAKGTSVLEDWQNLSAVVRNRGFVPDGDIVAIVDITLDSLLLQRHFVKFSRSGARRSAMVQDGILYDRRNYVNDGKANFFFTKDKIIVPVCIGDEKSYRTRLYTHSGRQITELGSVFCEAIIPSDDGLKMLVRDEYTFCVSEVDMQAHKYTLDDLGVSCEGMEIDCRGAHAYIFESESKVCKAVVELDEECTLIPSVRFKRAEWDDEAVVFVSANLWDVPQESRWALIPRPVAEPRVENVNGYILTVHPSGPDGISIYTVSTNIWTGEGLRYGYIGYDVDLFTQPLFEEARNMLNGKAAVKTGGEWIEVHIQDLLQEILP